MLFGTQKSWISLQIQSALLFDSVIQGGRFLQKDGKSVEKFIEFVEYLCLTGGSY